GPGSVNAFGKPRKFLCGCCGSGPTTPLSPPNPNGGGSRWCGRAASRASRSGVSVGFFPCCERRGESSSVVPPRCCGTPLDGALGGEVGFARNHRRPVGKGLARHHPVMSLAKIAGVGESVGAA